VRHAPRGGERGMGADGHQPQPAQAVQGINGNGLRPWFMSPRGCIQRNVRHAPSLRWNRLEGKVHQGQQDTDERLGLVVYQNSAVRVCLYHVIHQLRGAKELAA